VDKFKSLKGYPGLGLEEVVHMTCMQPEPTEFTGSAVWALDRRWGRDMQGEYGAEQVYLQVRTFQSVGASLQWRDYLIGVCQPAVLACCGTDQHAPRGMLGSPLQPHPLWVQDASGLSRVAGMSLFLQPKILLTVFQS
jgi:hypothetical protein